jgi:hypothetical protein
MSSWRNRASTRGEVNSVACCIVLAGMVLNGRAEALDAAAPAAASIEQVGESGSVKVSPRGDPTSESNAVKPPQIGNPFWAIPLKQLSNTRERPIFSPSRRPPPTPNVDPLPIARVVVPRPPPAPERPQLSLMGAVVSEGDGIAIFMEEATKDIFRLRMGEAYKGWILRFVRRREATLERDGKTAVLAFPPLSTGGDGGTPKPIGLAGPNLVREVAKRLTKKDNDLGTVPKLNDFVDMRGP